MRLLPRAGKTNPRFPLQEESRMAKNDLDVFGDGAMPSTLRHRPCGNDSANLERLQILRELRQVAAAALRDEHHVLDAHAADAEVVETRLDRHDRAALEDAVAG